MNDQQDLTARFNLIPGDTSGIDAVDKFNQRIAGMRQRTDALKQGFEDIEKIKLENLKKEFQSVEAFTKGMEGAQKHLLSVRKRMEELKEEFRSGSKDADRFTKEMSELEQQARKLDSALDAAGEKRRLDIGTGNLVDPSRAGAGGGLRQFGRELRNLPSTQIPGLGIGTDAVGNITRVSGALVDASEKSKVAAAAANLLTPALGAQAAATTAAFAPIALLVAGIGTVVVALKVLTDATSSNAEKINAFAENQRNLNERIAEGLKTEEARKELDKLTEAQERNKDTLATLQAGYDSAMEQLGALGGVVKVFSGDEDALANQINLTNEEIKKQQNEINALSGALENGSLAANDAAAELEKLTEKEKELTQQRQTSIDKIQALNDQERDLNAKFNQQQITQMVDRARQMGRVDEDYKIRDLRAEEDHTRQLLKLNKDFHSQITKINVDSQERAEDAVAALAKQEEASAEKRSKAIEDLNEKVADAESKYRKQAEKDAIEFGRRRREIENNFQRETSEARLDFDVRAFKDAQDEQKRELADLRTDRKDAKNERLEELKEEREAANENHDERLKQIDEEITKAREQANERIAEINIQQEAQLESLRTTHQERLGEDAETRRVMRERELEDRQRTAERQREDYEILTLRQKNAHDQQIKNLNDLELKELAIYYERDAQLTALLEKTKELSNLIGGTSSGTGSTGSWDAPTTPVNQPSNNFPTLPSDPSVGGGGSPKLMNPLSLARRSPLANPAAFANRGGGGGGRNNVTLQVNVSGNAFGNVWTQDQADAMAADIAAKIDLKQIETIDVVGMAINNKSRVT
jgi:hypothetical protein